jgi:GDP-4-dehydro-6-deoxy-D-mannose reductase
VRVLVTGADGFVGGRLLPRLGAEGWEATGIDREVDVAEAQALGAVMARVRPDAVVHLAAVSSVAESRFRAPLTYRVNFLGTLTLLEAVAAHVPQARVLVVGSGEQYGTAAPGAPAFTEEAPFRPRSPYARTKACADRLGALFAERGLDVVRVRAFNHTGAGQSDDFVASSFARQAAEIAAGVREPPLRVGNLDSVRDFLDVEDVVAAYVALLSREVPAGPYNIASGQPRRIGDLLQTLLDQAGVNPAVEIDPERLRPTDHSVGDASRLRQCTGWRPGIPFERTLAELLNHWRDRIASS